MRGAYGGRRLLALLMDTTSAAPRTAWDLLTDRTVGTYVAARLTASIGIWITNVVAAIIVFDRTQSALLVGIVSVAGFSPQVVLAPFMGALADRGNRRVQAVAGRIVIGSSLAVVAVIEALGTSSPWPVIVASLGVGVGFAVSAPALHALVPSMAAPADLPTVVALTTSPFTFARAVGPALGALLLLVGGPGAAFAVAAATQVVLATVVARLRLRPTERVTGGDRSTRAGLRHVQRDRVLLLMLLGVVGVGIGVDPVLTLTPSMAEGYGGGASLVAAMASAFGVGAAAFVLVLPALSRRVEQPALAVAGMGTLAASLVGFAASPTVGPALVALALAGAGMMAATSGLTTGIQQRVPEELRGRVMALWSVAFIGSRPLAATANGAIADAASPQWALLAVAVLLALVALVIRPARLQARESSLP